MKAVVSLERVLRHYQVPALRQHRDQLQGPCPIHRGQRNDSFRASLSKNAFQCFACQARGNVLDFVAAMERCSVREAALRLQRWFQVADGCGGAPHTPAAGNWERELVRKKERGNSVLGFALRPLDASHWYMTQRGIDRSTAAAFGVRYYAGPGLLSRRIVIPIHNQDGQRVGYAGRAIEEGVPKYKLPAGFRKGLELFHQHRAIATGSKTVIVVEGYFDCMRVHQAGFPWVIGLMGSALSATQAKAIWQQYKRVVVMLDGDAAGRAGSRAIHTGLAGKCEAVGIELPEGLQPDQLPPAKIRELVAAASAG